MQGIIIAGTHSGCGKTTITLGILSALKKKGLTVQSFKSGPDFIDAGLHRMITGRPSRNLDLWMCGEEYVKACFYEHSRDADISIVEGVMGMYDGDFSTAKLSDVLDLPVILIVDAYGMAESAGAVVKGFASYDLEYNNMRGVIFNRVASERHYERLKNSVHDVPVLGYLPRDLNFEIPHRHLGLAVREENPIAKENIERLTDTILKHVDIDRLMEDGRWKTEDGKRRMEDGRWKMEDGKWKMEDGRKCQSVKAFTTSPLHHFTHRGSKPKIGIAYDRAFCFYYEDNLDLLKQAGAEIIEFSPLNDRNIPEADAIYIGGGYPELYAERLSKNTSMLKAIYNWATSERPMYAECGGLMYLSRGIHNFEGQFFKMAGVFPFETQMKKARTHLGYREIRLKEDCILGKKGDKLRGHEFHYSEIKDSSQPAPQKILRFFEDPESTVHSSLYAVKNNAGQNLPDEGYKFKNTLASYIHIHFGSNSNIAKSFISFIKE
ncbi:cobyrinate a,c-diamide synthase [Dissulfurispira thermophila]|uniref:Cobyrinate a,c-diamide synthase n=2 Tax=root TaxID=1 RepID=A0A7G1H653_9BACT|nr:cobyrinate a,c-diamide synthase [Dissulfurispira thermophila]BCB97396.1 cobyrinate a,c-diamide synthase [Dissulfurispira thermophila]